MSFSLTRGSLMNRCLTVHSHLPESNILIVSVMRSTTFPFSFNLTPKTGIRGRRLYCFSFLNPQRK